MENDHSDNTPENSVEKQTPEALQTIAKRPDRIDRNIDALARSSYETSQPNKAKIY